MASVSMILAINELALPHLEINQRPEPLGMILPDLVSLYQTANELLIKYATVQRALAQNVLIDYRMISAPKPLTNGHRETHFWPRENRVRQDAFHALAQDVLRGPAAKFQPLGQRRRKLDQLVI